MKVEHMRLPREVVDLAEWLNLNSQVNMFAPGAAAELEALAPAKDLLARIGQKLETSRPEFMLLLCLQALRVQQDQTAPKIVEAEFVATVPEVFVTNARPTSKVVAELIAKARQEIVAVGYEISDGAVIESLQAASRRVAELVLLCDRGRGSGTEILQSWPSSCPRPRVYRDCERENASKYASMHSKCLIIDGEEMLITSANLTYHGLNGNIEFGVRLNGPPASVARQVFREIIQSSLIETVEV